MSQVSQEIVSQLPYLRRYARALTGSQVSGDQYVRVCLETLVEEPERIAGEQNLRLELFKLFHDIWAIVDAGTRSGSLGTETGGANSVARGLAALPSMERQVLLLVSLEGFSLEETARILDITVQEAQGYLDAAHADIRRQESTRVLIIEDDPLIAMDIAQIVQDMGHTVVGTAARKEEALAVAKEASLGLVLADIQLKDGDSGIDTVQELLQSVTVPVIFVTGFPERLLTGEAVEPAFLVTKPFDPETLRAAIGQALSV